MRITICVTTCGRPEGLRRVLQGIAAQRLSAELAGCLGTLVIDNHPQQSARCIFEELRSAYPWHLSYVHEPRQGVSQARNAALDHAADADFVAFLDDDEIPAPYWLHHLLDIQRRYEADVVAGPVLPLFVLRPPAWLQAGRFHEPRRYCDGAPLKTAFTGNVLFRRSLVSEAGLRFDEGLSAFGGEDIDFFHRLREAGAKLRYANSAVAYEFVGPERTTLSWLLLRWFRTGNSDGLVYLKHRGRTGRLRLIIRGLLRTTLGLLAFTGVLMTAGFGRTHRIIGRLYTVLRGLGMLSTALGYSYREYAQRRQEEVTCVPDCRSETGARSSRAYRTGAPSA